MHTVILRSFFACSLLLCLFAGARAALDERLHVLPGAEYGYWAPEIHEMYLRVPIKLDPIGGKEDFFAGTISVDGKPAEYTIWYVDGHTIDYEATEGASRQRITTFVPVTWRANEQHEIAIYFTYGGKAGEQRATLPTPKAGGAWAPATGGNRAFRVREEAGLARVNEPVEFDLTVPRALFPDPEHGVRATIMRAPGAFAEIPCQVYDVQTYQQGNLPLVRFRAAVTVAMPARSEAVVHLWACPPREPAKDAPITLNGGALGGTVSNTDYEILLDPVSGQLHAWKDKRLNINYEYDDPRPGVEGSAVVIHRTPDLYQPSVPWSHALDWQYPQNRGIAGPVFVETLRWDEMPGVPEVIGRVSYRFFAGRPEVRAASSMRVLKEIMVEGFRMGGMNFTPTLFTHFAYPRQDGGIVRVPLTQALGNDMGAPPPGHFPFNTPWVAMYHREKQFGIAMIIANYAYFTDGPGHANQSRTEAYVSNYRNALLYSIRSATQTYNANAGSYLTPLPAGTIMYEEAVYLPFSFTGEDARQFQPVEMLMKELRNPLVLAQ